MKSHRGSFLASAAALLMTSAARAELPELHSFHLPGLPFPAAMVAAMDGDKVVLKSRNEDIAVVGLDRFNKEDRDYIVWALNPATHPKPPQQDSDPQALAQAPVEQGIALRPNLEVTYTKEKIREGAEMNSIFPGNKLASGTFVLHLKVRNKSAQPSGALELHYQICTSYTDNALGAGGKNVTAVLYKGGTIPCPSLVSGESTTLDTESFIMRVDSTDAMSRGTTLIADGKGHGHTSRHKDEFKGITVVFKRNDVPVFEYVSPGVKKYP